MRNLTKIDGVIGFRLSRKILYQLYDNFNLEDRFIYILSLDRKKKRIIISIKKDTSKNKGV